MAESAVHIVIGKLVPLLIQEARLMKGIHKKFSGIKGELEMIQSFLKDADMRAEMDDMSNVAKIWVKQVREEAYHIEDVIDEYILHFVKQPYRQKRYFCFLKKVFQFAISLTARYVISSKIQDISKNLKEKKEMATSYCFNTIGGSSNDARSVTWHDPRVASLFIEKDEVVGIESHIDKLISYLVEAQSNRIVISTVGIGGVGKTTLVKKVYEDEVVVAHFDCRAWITVSQSYQSEELLRNMIKQFYNSRKEPVPVEIDTMKETLLMEQLRLCLHEHRYLVVFDDIWEKQFWNFIELALPNNEKGSRILITSRNEDVAPSNYLYRLPILPLEKAWELFCKKVFRNEGGNCPPELVELSRAIVERCEGLPLAIVAIGGLLSTKDKVFYEFRKLHESLSSELKSNPDLKNFTKILSLSYHDLSYNLKACFLYFGMFPEDYYIHCARLIRLWIAECFVEEMQGITLEEVAHGYLNQLIRRSLVQVEEVDSKGMCKSCRVHDMLHEVILSRSEELSFSLVSMQNASSDRIGRRVSIQNYVNSPLKSITSSQTRSILIFRVEEVPNSFLAKCFANFKLIKIMDFEGAHIDYIPKEVGNLFHLRYLSLRDTKVRTLPKSMGKLHNLETLDLKRSLVSELPTEISGLCKLRYLVAYTINFDNEFSIHIRRPVKIHNGIGCLQFLQKLSKIEADNAALIEELGSLVQLRKLQISKLKRENGMALCTELEKMSLLRSLRIDAVSEEEVLELQSMSAPLPLLQSLYLAGRLEKLPKWISKLKSIVRIGLHWSGLLDDPLKVLQALPNLMDIWFYNAYGGEQLHIEEGGFQKLKILSFLNFERLNRLIIDEGALPLLENLEIGPSPQFKEVPSGFPYLKNLKNIDFYDMPTEFVLSLQPNEGHNFGKVKHVKSSMLPLFVFCIGFVGYTMTTTSSVSQSCWSVCEGSSRAGEPKCPHHF